MNKISDNIYLAELSRLSGSTDLILSGIPDDLSGVYSFFRGYNFSSGCSDDELYSLLIDAVESKHMLPREANLAPLNKIMLESSKTLSKRKKEILKDSLKNANFKGLVERVLMESIFFQTPLYIGKSSNIRERIRQHLNGDSSNLKEDLKAAGIDIRTCNVLMVLTNLEEDRILSEEDEQVQALEDCLSRIFCPGFTRRYG